MQCRIGSCEEGRARAQNGHLAIVMASYLQAREPGFFSHIVLLQCSIKGTGPMGEPSQE